MGLHQEESRAHFRVDRPLVIAHRGSSAHAPENTLAAFRDARNAGADWVELDVQLSADGTAVCLHDFCVNRTTDSGEMPGNSRPHSARSLTLRDIQALDAGSWFGPEFSRERIPTLAEALNAIRGEGRAMGVLVEVKDAPLYGEEMPQLAAIVARELARADLPNASEPFGGAIVQSFYPEALLAIRSALPKVARFQLVPPLNQVIPERYQDLNSALDAVSRYADGLAIPESEATAGNLERIRDNRIPVFIWTVNDASRMRELQRLCVDGIITDDPGLAREVLGGRASL